MLQSHPLRWLASSAFALCVSGCAPDDERSRLTTQLPRDGYALFKVSPGGARRVAFLVEMRDVKDASFVLLYTPNEPSSSGWFELAAGAFEPCRGYGDDSTEYVELGCVLPDGHGALVDSFDAKPWPSTLVMRHQLGHLEDEDDRAASGTSSSSSNSSKAAPGGYYAVMRIAKTGPALPMAVEVVSMDETEPYDLPSVERVR